MNGICGGWFSERCYAVADLELTEKWEDGSWRRHQICVEHAKHALDCWPAENDPADTWTLEPLAREWRSRSTKSTADSA